jgi:hypothetical protein
LAQAPWASRLVAAIADGGGVTYKNKPLLFEARVGHALSQTQVALLAYEVSTGVGGSTVDFCFGVSPVWLAEVVSIGRSDALEAATHHAGPFFQTVLTSPQPSQSVSQRIQSEEGESLLVVQKIGQKVHDGRRPIKFPEPIRGRYHVVIVDMRGYLGGGDIHDWKQIAYGAEVVEPQYQKVWIGKNDERLPLLGVWHPQNTQRFAATARERLHAILFVNEQTYRDSALTEECWLCFNPHLVTATQARDLAAAFPLLRRR